MTDAREELERIVLEHVEIGRPAHFRCFLDAIIAWADRRHPTPPAEKVWPCKHIEYSYFYKAWEVSEGLENQGQRVPGSWSICPVSGCGATRPKVEGEKPNSSESPNSSQEPPAATQGEKLEACARCGASCTCGDYTGRTARSAKPAQPAGETEEEVERLRQMFCSSVMGGDWRQVIRWILSRDRAKESP